MKKLFFLFSLLFCFSTVYGGIWNKSAGDSGGLFGSNSGNQTNISLGSSDDRKGGEDGKLVNESTWNVDADFMGVLMPDQTQKTTVTSPIAIGTTYKFSETLHIVYKYVSFTVDGASGTEWEQTHHLAGFGFRRFFNNNEMQFIASVGSGTSSLKEKSGQVELGKYDSPIWADISFLYVIDNFSFGPRFSFVQVDSKQNVTAPIKGGYSFVGFTVQFGIPEL